MSTTATLATLILAMTGLTGCVSSGRIAECMWEKEPDAARQVVSATDRDTQVRQLMVGYNSCGKSEALMFLDESKLIRKLHEKDPNAELGPEAAFVACLAAKQPDMIAKIRDAKGEQEFLAALKEGAEICPAKIDGMSMGKLFDALNAHKQGNGDA